MVQLQEKYPFEHCNQAKNDIFGQFYYGGFLAVLQKSWKFYPPNPAIFDKKLAVWDQKYLVTLKTEQVKTRTKLESFKF